MAIFSTITAGAGAAKSIIKPISSLFGGSSCSREQKQQKKDIENAIRTYLTPGDMRNLVAGMESDVSPTPSSMAEFFLGGRDCKHKNVSPGDQRFLDRLPAAIEAAQQAQQSPEPVKKNFAASVTKAPQQIAAGVGGTQWLFVVGIIALLVFNRKALGF